MGDRMSWADAVFKKKEKAVQDNNAKIAEMRNELGKLVSDWRDDNSWPRNLVRETGLGQRVSIVDVFCGGYQNPHAPVTVGWSCSRGSRCDSGVVVVANPADKSSVQAAIREAQAEADAAYVQLFGLPPPSPVKLETVEAAPAKPPEPADPFALESA